MSAKKEGGETGKGGYARKVMENSQRFSLGLMGENERLRALAAALQVEKLRLEEEVLAAHEAIDHHKREQLHLQRELAEITSENRHFTSQFAEIEQQNSNLVNLYVATYRLHGTVDRQEAIAIIQEIVANLIGSEEMGIFEADTSGQTLVLIGSNGIKPEEYKALPASAGLIGRVFSTGERYVAGEGDTQGLTQSETELTACIPLRVGDRSTGALAIFRLLPQKSGIEALDRELFDLLATHAATALLFTALAAKAAEAH